MCTVKKIVMYKITSPEDFISMPETFILNSFTDNLISHHKGIVFFFK